MQVQVEKTSPTQCTISVTVPAPEVDAAFAKAYRELGKSARLPGFRPGKIPTGMLEARFGSQVRSEVQNDLVTYSLPLAMQQENLNPIAVPSIAPGALQKGNAFSYSAEVEVQPEIQLRRYKHLVVEPVKVEVNEQEVKDDLEAMRQQAAQLVPVMLRDVVEQNDIVQMDYEAFVNGAPVPGSKAENALIEIGGEGYLPGFSEGLLGAKVPSERELNITFPDDYTVKDLAGKPVAFKISLKELKSKELPNLDDDFAKDLGAESLAALEEKIRGSIRLRRDREAEVERRKAALKALVAANPFDLPPSLVRAQTDQMIASAAARVQQMMGQKLQLNDADMENLRKDSAVEAEQTVRSGILMLEVAKHAGINVDDPEIDAEIDRLAEHSGGNPQRTRSHYADPEQRSSLRFRLLEDKTLALLLSNAVEKAEQVTEPELAQAEPKAKTTRASKSKEEEPKDEPTAGAETEAEAEVEAAAKSKTKAKPKTQAKAKPRTSAAAKPAKKKTSKKSGSKKSKA